MFWLKPKTNKCCIVKRADTGAWFEYPGSPRYVFDSPVAAKTYARFELGAQYQVYWWGILPVLRPRWRILPFRDGTSPNLSPNEL